MINNTLIQISYVQSSEINLINRRRKELPPLKVSNLTTPHTHTPDFEFLEVLGQGCSAVVKRATRRSDGLVFAVKIVRTLGDLERTVSSRNEFDLLNQLKHPNIMKVHEFIDAGELCFLVMDFIDGSPVSKITWVFDISEIITISYQLANALTYLHDHGVTHRDINPHNVLISGTLQCGKESHVTLIDFNCATFQTSLMISPTGHREFAAPEVFAIENETAGYDGKVDVWGVAQVIMSLIRGTGSNVPGAFSGHKLEDLLSECLQIEPSKRPTARELNNRLRCLMLD